MANANAAPKMEDVGDDDDADFSRPELAKYVELPTGTFSDWDRVGQVKGILKEFRLGQFRDAALLCDQMLEDDRISGDLSTRTAGLMGSPMQFDPPFPDDPMAQKIAAMCERQWKKVFPTSSKAELFRWGIMLGIGVAEIIYDTRGPLWMPRVKVWHPQYIQWRWDTRSYWLTTQNESMIELPNTDNEIHSNGKWLIYTPYGYSRGWMRALIRSLAMPWLIRQWTYRDSARYSEVHGLPTRKAIVPPDAPDNKKMRHLQKVANLGNEPTILLAQGAAGNQYDVSLLEAGSTNYQIFDMLIDRTEKSISIRLLGQDSSNRAQGGSLADAKENIRDDYKRGDAESMSEVETDQLGYWFVGYNFGDAKLAPRISHNVEPADDEASDASVLNTTSQALDNLEKHGADTRAILEAADVPLIPQAEWNALKEQKKAAADALASSLSGKKPGEPGDEGDDTEEEDGKKPPPGADEETKP